MFKPYQISSSSQKELKANKNEFLQSLKDQLSKIEVSESSRNIIPETPQSGNINALNEESESEQSQPDSEDINNLK